MQEYYELRIYRAVPGRLPDLQNRFSQHTTKFFAKHGIAFWAISSFPQSACMVDGDSRVENRPRATTRPVAGLMFHWIQFLNAISLLVSAVRFRAAHVVIDSGTTQWFAFGLFRLFVIEVYPTFTTSSGPRATRRSAASRN